MNVGGGGGGVQNAGGNDGRGVGVVDRDTAGDDDADPDAAGDGDADRDVTSDGAVAARGDTGGVVGKTVVAVVVAGEANSTVGVGASNGDRTLVGGRACAAAGVAIADVHTLTSTDSC